MLGYLKRITRRHMKCFLEAKRGMPIGLSRVRIRAGQGGQVLRCSIFQLIQLMFLYSCSQAFPLSIKTGQWEGLHINENHTIMLASSSDSPVCPDTPVCPDKANEGGG